MGILIYPFPNLSYLKGSTVALMQAKVSEGSGQQPATSSL